MYNNIEFNATNSSVDVKLKGEGIILTIEDVNTKLNVIINSDEALRLVDNILDVCGEKNTDELQDKIFELENRVNELEEEKDQLNDRIEYMRINDRYIPF